MTKRIIFFLLAAIGCFQTKAQDTLAGTIRKLFEKIDQIPSNELSPCKKIITYKNNLSKIDPLPLNEAITNFIIADSQFREANKGKSCPVSKIVGNLDTLLRNYNSADPMPVLNAFFI